MAAYRGAKGQRGGDYKKREAWSGPRDFNNRSGTVSPGTRRSNSPRQKQEHNEIDQHQLYAKHLLNEWKKVEHDLSRDEKPTGTLEYIVKTPIDIKDGDLCNVDDLLKKREQVPCD